MLLSYVDCLPLLFQVFKWLNGKSIRSWIRIPPAGFWNFFRGFIPLSTKTIHERLLFSPVNNIKPSSKSVQLPSIPTIWIADQQ